VCFSVIAYTVDANDVHFCDSIYTVNASDVSISVTSCTIDANDECFSVTAYTMDANEAQEEYEEVQTELRKKEEEVSSLLGLTV